MGLKRSLVSIAAASLLAAGAFAAPAEANQAHGGAYAASVATKPAPATRLNTSGSTVKLGARPLSTSTVVKYLHGTVKLTAKRVSTGKTVYTTTLTVNGKSGAGYWVTVPRSKFKSNVSYRLYATFTATSGHIEKNSSGYISFKY